MQFDIAFRSMNKSIELRSYAERKIKSALKTKLQEPIWIDMIFSKERFYVTFHCYIYCGTGLSYHSKSSHPNNMSIAIDDVIVNLKSQLRSYY
jgi:ribosome-associated translation inhibitor RaiA